MQRNSFSSGDILCYRFLQSHGLWIRTELKQPPNEYPFFSLLLLSFLLSISETEIFTASGDEKVMMRGNQCFEIYFIYVKNIHTAGFFFFSKLELQLARYLFAYDQSCLWAEPGYNVFIENFMVFIFYYTDALPSCQRYFSRFKRATSYTCRQRQTMLIVKTNLANLSNRIRQTCNEFNFKVKQLL